MGWKDKGRDETEMGVLEAFDASLRRRSFIVADAKVCLGKSRLYSLLIQERMT